MIITNLEYLTVVQWLIFYSTIMEEEDMNLSLRSQTLFNSTEEIGGENVVE